MSLSVSGLLSLAGSPVWAKALAIVLATFVLEDAATVIAAMHVADGSIGTVTALVALYAGIVLGDLGLYGLGRLAARVPRVARWVTPRRMRQGRRWLDGRVFRVVFVSRFIPGARLPTYTACGFLGANLALFAAATALATTIWTSGLFLVSLKVGAVLMQHLGVWRWAGAAGFIVVLALAGRTAARHQEAP